MFALGVRGLDDLGRALEVDLEAGLVGAVVHDGGEAGLDALEDVLVGAVVEVEGHGHGDVLVLKELLDDVSADLVAALPLGSAAGALDDDRGLELLGGVKDRGRPLEVVGVERADGVVALLGTLEHGSCVNEHIDLQLCLDPLNRNLPLYDTPTRAASSRHGINFSAPRARSLVRSS